MRANFGLGDATKADLVRIEWPSILQPTGCEERATLGHASEIGAYPERVESPRARCGLAGNGCNPFRVDDSVASSPA
jgi:hypothetical protein